jgi:multiple sugar transport system ATP-binding protein
MIYVIHDQVEAMTMGDRICVMRDGLIMQVADPLTLYRQPENLFVAGFIGSPPMNLLKGKIKWRDGGLFFVETGENNALTFPLKGVWNPSQADTSIKISSSAFVLKTSVMSRRRAPVHPLL